MSANAMDSIKQQVLVIESPVGSETTGMMRRLRELGAPIVVVRDFVQAEFALQEPNTEIGAVLIPTRIDASVVATGVAKLQSLAPPTGLGFISVGDVPTKAERKTLRRAEVSLAVWNPSSEAMLRFQLNRALHPDRNTFGMRDRPRIPTELSATVTMGQRSKEAQLYSLAETGAFLATMRAIMEGATIALEVHLGDGPLHLQAVVVYANVPGNLQRPGLPLGMGVRFIDLSRSDSKRLRGIIDGCLDRLEV